MINNSRNSNMDYLYEEPNPIDDYLSMINTETSSSKYYYNIQNNVPNNYNLGLINDFNHKIHSLQSSQEKNNFFRNRNNVPLNIIKTNTNTNNHKYINEFSFWDKNLSSLSINKYKQMREINNYQAMQNDINNYKNNFLINYTHSINNSFDRDNNIKDKNKTNDFYMHKNNNGNENNVSMENIKVKKNNNLKNNLRLNKEIINYNRLEKKINEIEKKRRHKQLKKIKKHNHKNNTPIINFNNDEIKNKKENKLNDSLLNNIKINTENTNNIKISTENTNKKLKRRKGDEDDILNNPDKKIKRNTTFIYNEKEKEENINYTFIKYLKKDNSKLIQINTIYKQLIDSFFYFINQLSKKYDFKKEIKDINHYLSNANDLSNTLIDLEQHLNKVIKSNEINKEKTAINNNNIVDNKNERENDADKEEELLNRSKFITINNTDNKIKKNQNPFSTRNLYCSRKFLTQNNKSLLNNSINYYNNSNVNEINTSGQYKSKGLNKFVKIRKSNGKLIKVMNKLNFEFFSPNQKNFKNKIIIKNNKAINESNDLKSIINPKFLKEANSYKYIN